jgi:hypothetical protein
MNGRIWASGRILEEYWKNDWKKLEELKNTRRILEE